METLVIIILLKIITTTVAIEIIPLQNNVLPILLGKAYVTNRNLQLIYHIDLNKMEELIIRYQREIENLKDQQLGFAQTANHRYLQHSNKININTLEELLNEKIRIKRGLINLGGKISKILFGTLDSDDEELYRSYFNSIEKNENTLMRNQKQIATIVNDLKNKYIDKFQKMNENLELLKIVPELRAVEQMHLMTFELKDIKIILDEIQTAVSFARLHLLHESILPYTKFAELIKNVTIIPVYHLKDYYQLCHTKVVFRNKTLLFLISIPTIYERSYDLYKFYYLSQSNLTLPQTYPYMLSQEEILKWSTNQCHPIEEDFLCDQDSLNKPPQCLENILRNHTENCPRTKSIPASDLKLLEDGSILSLENEKIQEKCPQQIKHYFIPPAAILRSKCVISNTQKDIFPVTTVNEEKYIILPRMTTSIKNHSNDEDFKKEDEIPDIDLEELDQWNHHPSKFSFLLFLLITIIIIIIIACILKYFRKYLNFTKVTPSGDAFLQEGEESCNNAPY